MALSLASPLLIASLVTSGFAGQVHYVDVDAPAGGDGSSWGSAFNDVQTALSGVQPGEEIWVAEGAYVPGGPGEVTAAFDLVSGAALYGGFAGGEVERGERDPAAHLTKLSGDLQQDDVYGAGIWYQGWDIHTPNTEHVVRAIGIDGAVLDGFTIQAGYATFAFGGGLYLEDSSVVIANCTVTRNLAGFSSGGGAYMHNSTATIAGSRFHQNYAHDGSGGGLFCGQGSSLDVTDSTFSENRCVGGSTEASGGGVALYNLGGPLSSTFARCRFTDNTVVPFFPVGGYATRGGGIHNFFANVTAIDCEFEGNWANSGGGIFTWDTLLVVNSLFQENTVVAHPVNPVVDHGGFGAGIASSSSGSDVTTIVNSVFWRNHAGEAAGVSVGGNHHARVLNSILWGNTATGSEVTLRGAQIKGSADIEYSCVQGLLMTPPGEDPPDPSDYPGSFDDDPLFASEAASDLHLAPTSPCIDAGNNLEVPAAITHDLDGRLRFHDDPQTADTGAGAAPIVDMGTFEFGAPAALGTLYCESNANSTGAVATIAAFGSPRIADNDVRFLFEALPADRFGYLLMSATEGFVPLFGGSQGDLCLGQPQIRFSADVLDSGAAGSVEFQLDITALPQGTVFQPGETWHFQYWYRDMNPGNTSNTTGGLAVDFE